MYVGAYVRRHVGLGPGGNPGTIYKIQGSSPPTILATLSAGSNPHTLGTAGGPGLDANASWWYDKDAYDAVGKVGLGDLELSDDGQTLYAVNLAARTVDMVNVGVSGATGSIQLAPETNCPASVGVLRPFGLGAVAGKLYIGATCTAENTVDANSWGDPEMLRGYVFEVAQGSTTPNKILDFKFSSLADRPINGASYGWKPWSSRFTPTDSQPATNTADPENSGFFWPTPMVADIEISGNTMYLGIRDRHGDQMSRGAGGLTVEAGAPSYEGIPAGDVLSATRSNGSGPWDSPTSSGSINSFGGLAIVDGALTQTVDTSLNGPQRRAGGGISGGISADIFAATGTLS